MAELCQVKFYCCMLCKGLFTEPQALLAHQRVCDGSTSNSDAPLFACAKPPCEPREGLLVGILGEEPISGAVKKEHSDCEVQEERASDAGPDEGAVLEDHDYTSQAVEAPATHRDPSQSSTTHTTAHQPAHGYMEANFKREDGRDCEKKVWQSAAGSSVKVEEERGRDGGEGGQNSSGRNQKCVLPASRQGKRRCAKPVCQPCSSLDAPADDESPVSDSGASQVVVLVKKRKKGTSRKQRSQKKGKTKQNVKNSSETPKRESHACSKERKNDHKVKAKEIEDEDDFKLTKTKSARSVSKEEKLKETRELIEKYKDYCKMEELSNGNKERMYQCPDCPKKTKHIGFFNRHMVGCHPPPLEGKEGALRAWKCDQCDFVTDSKPRLVQHRYKHKKSLMCEVCSMCFALRRDLDTHRWIHKGGATILLPLHICVLLHQYNRSISLHNSTTDSLT